MRRTILGFIIGTTALGSLTSSGTAFAGGRETVDFAEMVAILENGGGVEGPERVDCLLPGRVQRLGLHTTYLGPRRWVKLSRMECAARGGEYVVQDLAALPPKR